MLASGADATSDRVAVQVRIGFAYFGEGEGELAPGGHIAAREEELGAGDERAVGLGGVLSLVPAEERQAQLLRLSLFSRNKRKDPAKAYDTLVSGAKLLFPRGDVTAGSELALTLSKVSEPRPRSEAIHTRSL